MESKPAQKMGPERVSEISQKIVSFFLENEEVKDDFKKMIVIDCPELQILINNDERLREGYISTMIVHRIPGLPFPKEDLDSFISKLLSETKLSNNDFIKWLEKIKSNKEMGLHFGIENPIYPN